MTNNFSGARVHTREETRAGYALSGAGHGTGHTTAAAGVRRETKVVEQVSLNRLLANRLLSALPGEDFARILPHLEPVSLSAGEVLYQSDEISFTYFPETAVISHLHIMADGHMTEAAMIGREGMVGLSAVFNSPSPAYLTEVALAGNALRVRANILRQEFARGGAMQQLLLSYAGARMAQLSQRAVCNGYHKVEERFCTWLLMAHDRAGEDRLALTHEQIAQYLGTRRAGVTEAANALREKNIINYSRGQVRILDRRRMELAACLCYSAARGKSEALP